ncbi:TPA: FaeA/PapI family transcriptional regulator [Escherichia coli]|uniref:FaeA/PapI family transcriptional regulator n=1 Tax=Escherichia coli TaxID=562 RepID=UPI0017F8F68B|nr:ArsR family transcriptional regulator [Escherichia coli]
MKKKQILDFIENINAPCRTTDIATHFDMSSYQVRHYLICLEKEGKIIRSPLRRGARTLWMAARGTVMHQKNGFVE